MINNTLKTLLVGSFVFISLNANADFNIRIGVGNCGSLSCSNSFDRQEADCGSDQKPCRANAFISAIAVRVACENTDPFLRIIQGIRDCPELARETERQLSQRCVVV